MTTDHTRTLGPKIVADFRLLNHLRGRSIGTVDDIEPGSTRIEVEGGVIASSCVDDHDEVLTCWAFYRERRRPD
jgi:hypothetical protein